MEIIMTKDEMVQVEKSAMSNLKIKDLLETLKENDMISIDKDHGIVALHSVTIPVVLSRCVEE